MRIGIVGGTDKNKARYEEVAKAAACQVEFHDGYMKGRASEALEALCARCDVVVIVTRVNSHSAVQLAREESKKRGREPHIVRRFGLRQLRELACNDAALRHGDRSLVA